MEHVLQPHSPEGHLGTTESVDARAARLAVKEQAENVGADVRELGTLVRDAVRAELASLRGQGEQLVTTAREHVDDAESSLTENIRRHPLRSIAWAAGAGLVLGMVARR